ncbi:tRNA (adenosine(37)-N6)-dimethylallyltransferase MiaA [Telluribacter sp. SYSU D00476]|uniref:tRNA (adenosine(37)-N6)-dimethylallyltransferase MiaA n=1 Tax=Telluribacter sp. SYSU D00476 TaxID=2811430 RepID=UPI001FF3F6D4|nr:tRNA (adenosine(37)-N6)-dimethylallyltransferase MiaA [Telluribacter sp. SYSU D00476]
MLLLLPIIVILGPTASGKTHLAVQVAQRLGGEIISVDSRQVYRGMDIGTGKDLSEYTTSQGTVPYHLIDIVEAGEKYNVHRFQEDFRSVLNKIQQQGKPAVVCGGTGLYLDAVLRDHQYTSIPVDEVLRSELEQLTDEELYMRFESTSSSYSEVADTSTRKRLVRAIEISTYLRKHPELTPPTASTQMKYLAFGLNPPVEIRRERISTRLRQRLQHGLIEEVEGLLQQGLSPEQLIYYGLEYKYLTEYLTGQLTYEHMIQRLETEIHRFAKRQMTFFRKMERDGIAIQWLHWEKDTSAQVEEIVARWQEAQSL